MKTPNLSNPIDLFDAIKERCSEDLHDGEKYLNAAFIMLLNMINDLPGFEISIKKHCDTNLKDVSDFGGPEGVLLRGCDLNYFELSEFVKIMTESKTMVEGLQSAAKPKI